MRFIIGDTETTGLPPCKAVEVALLEVDSELNEIGRWESLIDPEIPITVGAQNIHGISSEMVADSPTMEELVTLSLGGGLQGDICLIGHNTKFDRPMLSCVGNITQEFCTLKLSRLLVHDSGSHKLQTLREYFGIAENKAHSAMGDVLVTLEILRKLLTISGKSLVDHISGPSGKFTIMPFGKYRGYPITNLPVWYLNHMLTLDIDADLREALTLARSSK